MRTIGGILTWFMSTSVPAFSPPATASSSAFSNRFFSRTTAFKKSVLSINGAYQTVLSSHFYIKKSERGDIPAPCQSTPESQTESYRQYAPARKTGAAVRHSSSLRVLQVGMSASAQRLYKPFNSKFPKRSPKQTLTWQNQARYADPP
jgi:hypothetical protein